MPDLFFYGTLCHVPLLEYVLGRPADQIDMAPAILPDHAAFWVVDHSFPMIVATRGAAAPGLLVRNLSSRDVERLDFYEGGFEYALKEVTVQVAASQAGAQVYFPAPGLWQPGMPWDLADWADRWGTITVTAARDVMVQFGQRPAAQVRALWPFFCARAWSQQLGAVPAPQSLRSDMTVADVEMLAERPGFDGFFRMRAFDLRHRRFDGAMSEPMERESFISYDAALVLPYDPLGDRVLLIEQMRFGPLMRGDPAPWVLEPIAGLIDAAENPADCARREAVEEAGLTLGDLRPMLRVYASPGYTTEFYHCFLGLCDLSDRTSRIGGLQDEHEDIRSHVIPFEQAMALVDSGEINAGPLVMMLLWLGRHRAHLQAEARD